jgi:hypothetical protein
MIQFINKTLIDNSEMGLQTRQALATLALENFWQIQADKLLHDMIHGTINEPEDDLAKRILEVRKRVAHYQELQTLGLELSKGLSNA